MVCWQIVYGIGTSGSRSVGPDRIWFLSVVVGRAGTRVWDSGRHVVNSVPVQNLCTRRGPTWLVFVFECV